ncbi:MAG: 2-oxoacid:ferredoxin oxidoreductase subunit beta [Planctomycetes bacterium]|nr:2-oxoacid:ferredoxin oxidoreductase subunit beta [Planctomycetota bacterium]
MLEKPDMLHPLDEYVREERMPHIWCSGCGLGVALNVFLNTLVNTGTPKNKIAVVSGIGCSGRIAGYINVDSFHTTHGRAIPFATGLKLARPDLTVIVFSGEGDLIAIGGNHFIHAARRNVDITVICVNNSNYGMTGGQASPTTPLNAITSSTPYGNFAFPMSLPYLAAASGAVYVSRWTVYHARQLELSMRKAILKQGFSFLEIISPCPTLYARNNKIGSGLDMMKFYQKNTLTDHKAQLKDINIVRKEKIVVGNFVDIKRSSYLGLTTERRSNTMQKGKVFKMAEEERDRH